MKVEICVPLLQPSSFPRLVGFPETTLDTRPRCNVEGEIFGLVLTSDETMLVTTVIM